MTRRFVDLSIYLENDVVSDPPAFKPEISTSPTSTIGQIEPFFPGLKKEDCPTAKAGPWEKVTLSTHNGTHLDAPFHFHSTMDKALGEKKRAWTIDEVPLEWCFQPGVKLDFRHFGDGYVVTAADIEAELKRASTTRCSRWKSWWSPAPAAATDMMISCPPAAAWARRHHVPAGARRPADGHRRLELDAPFVHTAENMPAATTPA